MLDYEQQYGDFIAQKTLLRGYIVLVDKLYYDCTDRKWSITTELLVSENTKTDVVRLHVASRPF